MGITITESNRPGITKIINNLFPFLKLLLDEDHIVDKFHKYAPLSVTKIRSKDDIVTNVFDIITGNDFAMFRVHAPTALKQGTLFKDKLNNLKFLDKKDKELVHDIIEGVQKSEIHFMTELQKIIKSTTHEVQQCCSQLIQDLIDIFAKKCDSSSSHTYRGHGNKDKCDHKDEHHDKHHDEHHDEHHGITDLVHHEVDKVKALMFSAINSITSAVEHLEETITNNKKRPAPQDEKTSTTSKKVHLNI